MSELFDEDFLRKLDLLEILFKRTVVGRREGDRPGQQRGGRTEFAEHREYSPGDELRYLDWNVYARTERLFVKQFTKREAVLACVALDASGSMASSAPGKFDYARRLAAAFAYLALVGKNEAQIAAFDGGGVRWSPRFAGRPDIQAIGSFLQPLAAEGQADILDALRAVRERVRERGLLILVSDLLEPPVAAQRGLRLLGSQRFDLALLHVLSPQELHPSALGPVRLTDAETDEEIDLAVDDAALRLYADGLNAFVEGWRSFAKHHDVRYQQVSTATPFEECVLGVLRHGGLVR